MKRWKITWEEEPEVRHPNGHNIIFPSEMTPRLKLIEAMNKEPSPCDCCRLRDVCGHNDLACREFYAHVHKDEFRAWKKGAKSARGYDFDDMEEGPNELWHERIYATRGV